jgi:uncharacterized protein (TIGR02453 family)
MAGNQHFTNATFAFLRELAQNNSRPWFQANKERYEQEVKGRALQFVSDFGPLLKKISPHFRADPRPVGGSLFRIHRDTRFSKDKSPYKTHTGIQFRHEAGKDAHAPGFYLHIAPGSVGVGVGIWHPDSPALRKIREAIVEDPGVWKRAAGGKKFQSRFELSGESLKRPPKDFDPDHPLVEDLKRKDFIGFSNLNQKAVTSADFLEEFADICRAGAPLNRWVCGALGLPY